MKTAFSTNQVSGCLGELGSARDAVQRLLDACHGMDIAEMRRRTRLDEGLIRAALEGMLLRGEVDCITPSGHEDKTKEFFALNRPEGHPWDY